MELSKEQKALLSRMLRVRNEDVSIRAVIDTFDDRRKDKKDPSSKMSDGDFWRTILVLIEQPQLSERQLKMLHDLRANYRCHNNSVEQAIYDFLVEDGYGKIPNNELFEVLDAFKYWVQEQEAQS